MSRSEAVSSFGYDAEDMDREIAADNARADAMGLIFDSDPRLTQKTGAMQVSPVESAGNAPEVDAMQP
jgi:capsid protein